MNMLSVALSLLLVTSPTLSHAGNSGADHSAAASFADSQVDVYGKLHHHATPPTSEFESNIEGVSSTSASPYAYQYVDGCPGASPTNRTPACELAITACPRGQILQWLFRSPTDAAGAATGDWSQTGSRCVDFADAAATAGQQVAFPGFTAADFRKLPLPPGVAHVQPDTGYAVINLPTNVYASARQVVLPTTVVGIAVAVRATPASYQWTFGDGASIGPTSETGAPYPDLVLTHTYTQPADAAITLTTTYTGEYSVAGGPWLPIDGTASVVSAPVPTTVLSGHSALVDGPTGA